MKDHQYYAIIGLLIVIYYNEVGPGIFGELMGWIGGAYLIASAVSHIRYDRKEK